MQTSQDLGFVHRWMPVPGARRTLLLLHGTGGDEDDLLPLGRRVAPDANLLSPRGKVLENGMPRFFRRHAEGVLDLDDLRKRAHELADFVGKARDAYGLRGTKVVALGYSNGANVAIGMLFERPEALDGAILARAMLPYEPAAPPQAGGKDVLVLAGARDPYSRGAVTERLAAILREGGARVEAIQQDAGHELTHADVQAAEAWMRARA
jgi:phospholipase/carboxylesterase